MNTGKLLKLHKKLSMTALILCLFWIVSGFMHPIMGWVRPSAAQFRPPANNVSGDELLDVKKILSEREELESQAIRLVNFSAGQYYQVSSGKATLYFDSKTGEELTDGDYKYAAYLARHYSQKKSDIESINQVNSFDYRYPFINRLLPVQKVSFADGEDYFIHTRSSRLGTVGNELKDGMSLAFKLFHNLSPLDKFPVFKLILTTVFMFILVFVTCTGLLFFFKTWKKKRTGMRQWHRYIGLLTSLVIFALTFSGLFHMAVKTINMKKSFAKVPALSTNNWQYDISELLKDKGSLKGMSTAIINGDEYLRVVSTPAVKLQTKADSPSDKRKKFQPPNIEYIGLTSDNKLTEKEAATLLASRFMGKNAEDLEDLKLITRFAGEYGFVNKRLPVWKATFKNSSERVYVETSSQKLALKVDALKSAEGFSFAYLHKAHFLDFLGKDGRNIVLMLFCVLIGFVAVTGNVMKKKF